MTDKLKLRMCTIYKGCAFFVCELAFSIELGTVPGSDEAAIALIKKVAKHDLIYFY